MADYDRTVLDFYGLSTPFPTEWPEEKDESDASDDEYGGGRPLERRRSRYGALEKAVGDRRNSLLPGSEGGKKGMGNLVQKDEPDPLGSVDSVVRTLKHMGLPVQDDTRLRKSTTQLLIGSSEANGYTCR